VHGQIGKDLGKDDCVPVAYWVELADVARLEEGVVAAPQRLRRLNVTFAGVNPEIVDRWRQLACKRSACSTDMQHLGVFR